MSSATMVRAAVVGCTGYIGMQCVELLAAHPAVELAALRGRSLAGRRFNAVQPGSAIDLEVGAGLDVEGVDVVFAALPHTVAAACVPRWRASGAVVIDMSADFRLDDAELYQRWYGAEHPAPELLGAAVYGLVELNREAVREADLIAAPGCYPTAALLAVVPALQEGLVTPRVVVDAKSGVSGAGRSPSATAHFAEVNEAVRAYAVDGHRHGAEMAVQVRALAGTDAALTFVPHLVPMTRGILATVYLEPHAGTTAAALTACYRELCDANAFLRYDDAPPSTKSVTATNTAAMNCTMQGGTAVVTVAIDNLVKGAAGQAVQAMNVRFGFAESAGLRSVPSWP